MVVKRGVEVVGVAVVMQVWAMVVVRPKLEVAKALMTLTAVAGAETG